MENTVTFLLNDPAEEILRLDTQGFHYRGTLIEDAGEAHRLFLEWCNNVNNQYSWQGLTDDDIAKILNGDFVGSRVDCMRAAEKLLQKKNAR